MADSTASFTVGDALRPAAGEQKITREEAARIMAQVLAGVADSEQGRAFAQMRENVGDVGGLEGAGQALSGLIGDAGNVVQGGLSALTGGRWKPEGDAQSYSTLARKLVDLLPDDALYASLIQQVDRRQIYSQVMTGGKTASGKTVNGIKFTADERALAGDLYSIENEQARTAATGLAAAAGIVGDAEVQAYVEKTTGAYRTNRSMLIPSPASPIATQTVTQASAADQAAGGTGAVDETFASIAGKALNGAGGNTPFLTSQDVQQIFRLASTDLGATNTYLDQLAAYRANVDPNFVENFRVNGGAGIPGIGSTMPTAGKQYQTQLPGALGVIDQRIMQNAPENKGGPRNYTLSQAKDLLYGMSKDEVKKIQNLLLRAGYFADKDGNSTKPLFDGDPTDQTTMRGWLNLIGDTVRTGGNLFDTLTKRALDAGDRFADVDGRTARDVVLTDSAAIAQDSDTLGQRELGRKLTAEEHAKVVEFIHGLERETQSTLNAEGGQEAENVDVQAQINQYLQEQFPTEAAGRDTAETYSMFTSLLAGPGGR